jgi:hypothetical protein
VFDAKQQPLAQNDVAKLLNIPEKTLVLRLHWEVSTVEGATKDFALGDGVTTDGYLTTTTANTLASGVSPATTVTYAEGKYYSAADTIDLLAVTSGGLTACKISVKAFCVNFS